MKIEWIPPFIKEGFKKLLRLLILLFVRLRLNSDGLTILLFFYQPFSVCQVAIGSVGMGRHPVVVER
jgi:hypothetical protein